MSTAFEVNFDGGQVALNQSDIDRFWSKVRSGTDEECWPWEGARYPWGHGQFYVRDLTLMAPYVAAALLGREVTADHHVRTDCSERSCLNPAHLIVEPADPERRGRFAFNMKVKSVAEDLAQIVGDAEERGWAPARVAEVRQALVVLQQAKNR